MKGRSAKPNKSPTREKRSARSAISQVDACGRAINLQPRELALDILGLHPTREAQRNTMKERHVRVGGYFLSPQEKVKHGDGEETFPGIP
jgi:hypothetical protein